MYIILKGGSKIKVDEKQLNEEDKRWTQKGVAGIYDDDLYLKDVWVLALYKATDDYGQPLRSDVFDRTPVKEYRYDHKPTKEEILWAMTANGLGTNDMAFIEKGYEPTYHYD